MDFIASSSPIVTEAITDLGGQQFLVWGVLIGLVFALFLIVWGIRKTKRMAK